MIDYKVAFEEGLTAAEKAEEARREIDSVFEQLRREISLATDGKIIIERKYLTHTDSLWEAAARATLTLGGDPTPKPSYWAVVATNPTIPNGPLKELARWSMDKRGYPCELKWNGRQDFCEDKEALEQALADLLRDPGVGEKLYILMKLKPNEHETNGITSQDIGPEPSEDE